MRPTSVFGLAAVVITAAGCFPGGSSSGDAVAYGKTLAPALATASSEKRPVFLNFGGPW